MAFLFNVHVDNYNAESTKTANRVYVDPMGEKLSDGLWKAPKITHKKADQMYG